MIWIVTWLMRRMNSAILIQTLMAGKSSRLKIGLRRLRKKKNSLMSLKSNSMSSKASPIPKNPNKSPKNKKNPNPSNQMLILKTAKRSPNPSVTSPRHPHPLFYFFSNSNSSRSPKAIPTTEWSNWLKWRQSAGTSCQFKRKIRIRSCLRLREKSTRKRWKSTRRCFLKKWEERRWRRRKRRKNEPNKEDKSKETNSSKPSSPGK